MRYSSAARSVGSEQRRISTRSPRALTASVVMATTRSSPRAAVSRVSATADGATLVDEGKSTKNLHVAANSCRYNLSLSCKTSTFAT